MNTLSRHKRCLTTSIAALFVFTACGCGTTHQMGAATSNAPYGPTNLTGQAANPGMNDAATTGWLTGFGTTRVPPPATGSYQSVGDQTSSRNLPLTPGESAEEQKGKSGLNPWPASFNRQSNFESVTTPTNTLDFATSIPRTSDEPQTALSERESIYRTGLKATDLTSSVAQLHRTNGSTTNDSAVQPIPSGWRDSDPSEMNIIGSGIDRDALVTDSISANLPLSPASISTTTVEQTGESTAPPPSANLTSSTNAHSVRLDEQAGDNPSSMLPPLPANQTGSRHTSEPLSWRTPEKEIQQR